MQAKSTTITFSSLANTSAPPYNVHIVVHPVPVFSSKLRQNWIAYRKTFIFCTTIKTLIFLHTCMEGDPSATPFRQEQKQNSVFKLRCKLFLPIWIQQEDSYSLAHISGIIIWGNLKGQMFFVKHSAKYGFGHSQTINSFSSNTVNNFSWEGTNNQS